MLFQSDIIQDYNELEMVENVMRGFEKTIDGICSSEGSTDQEDILAVETCDKETNTVLMKYPKAAKSQDALGMECKMLSDSTECVVLVDETIKTFLPRYCLEF